MSGLKNLIGQRFGRLLVLEPAPSLGDGAMWLCICDCGNKKAIPARNLKTVRSCGCLLRENFIDLTGRRFDRLVVVEKRGYKKYTKSSHALWLVRCDCGKEKVVLGVNLRNGGSKSCGCLKEEQRVVLGRAWALLPGISSRNRILDSYKRGAKIRDLQWGLSEEEFDLLIKRPCHYCGEPPSRPEPRSHESFKYSETPDAQFLYNGIDRLDNTYGYTIGNVVSCCFSCNRMKGISTPHEFTLQARKIASHQSHIDLTGKID